MAGTIINLPLTDKTIDMNTNAQSSAFPVLEQSSDKDYWNTTPGLTKREYFAAMAMQGMLSEPNPQNSDFVNLAKSAVIYADQLLKELEKK